MFIRNTVNRYKDQTYTSYLLVESVSTPQGPRQRTICLLGDWSLELEQRGKWLGLANRIEAGLQGQVPLEGPDPLPLVEDGLRDMNGLLSGRPISALS